MAVYSDREFEGQKAAYLYGAQGMPQKKIKDKLHRTAGHISKLLAEGKKKGWWQIRCLIPEETRREIEREIFCGDKVSEKLQQDASLGVDKVSEIRIFDSGSKATDEKGYEVRLDRFGRLMAEPLWKLLGEGKIVAVSWGKTIAKSIPEFRRVFQKPPREKDPIQFIPVCGDLLEYSEVKFTSSSLVAELHEVFNGKSGEVISLGGLVARIPCKQPERDIVRNFFREHISGCRRVFEGERAKRGKRGREALIKQVDTILTSCGTASPDSNDLVLVETTMAIRKTREELNALTIGNIGGFFLPRPGLKKSESKVVKEINDQWTGIRKEHFELCANRGSPGVVLLAIGKAKAEIVCECVRLGLVNHLIIDHDLAEELGGIKGESGRASRRGGSRLEERAG